MAKRPSWLAGISALLGLGSLAGVLCFHFPELLTSQAFRAAYSEAFARGLLLAALVLAFLAGTLAVLRGHDRRTALVGVGAATLALLLGGARVELDPIRPTPWSLGLDWFLVSLLASALVFIPIERAFARVPQSPLRPGWRTDLAYFFASHAGIQFLLVLFTAWATGVEALSPWPALREAVRTLPAWLQFPLAVLLADLAQSLLHRAYHRVPWLWRFHAVHHSSERLDWLAGSRMHLLEIVLTRLAVLAPLVAAGFSAAALNAYVVFVGLQAVLAHANLGLRFGWLEHVLVLPRYHHWHHANDPAYADANYAIHLPLVDRLLGTHRLPPDGRWPEALGLHDPAEVPAEGFWRQHLAPLRRR